VCFLTQNNTVLPIYSVFRKTYSWWRQA